MADTPISGFTAASSVNDADVTALVQGGANYKLAMSVLASYIYQKKFIGTEFVVATYADLPAAADHSGKLAYVQTTTGSVLTLSRKTNGFYRSNGTTWVAEDIPYRDASSIYFDSTGLTNFAADDVQEALSELDSIISAKLSTISGIAAGGELAGTYPNPTVTNASVIAKVLTGFASSAGTVSATDSILQAFQKVVGNIAALVTGVSSVFGRTGAVTAQSGDYTTAQVTESGNLYHTTARARAAAVLNTLAGTETDQAPSVSSVNTALAGKANTSHTHAASDINSGTFADARIAASNVTQHQSALTIATSQLSGTIGTAQIANDAVTYAKIQNVSATDMLLGRSTAGAGDIEEIACTAAGRALIDDADAAAQRTTLGLGTLATQSGTFSGTSSGTNTGDQTITLTGDVTGSGTGSFAATIANNAVTLAKMATMATASFLGRNTASTGNVEVLSATTATSILNAMVGDSGSGGTKGLVPAPASGDTAAGKFLKADGTWAVPAGGGGGSPGGADTQVQFNDGGAFGGDAQLTFNKTSGLLNVTGAGTSGVALFKTNPGSGTSYFQVNDNGTVVINADVSTGANPLRILYNGTEQFVFNYQGVFSPRAGGVVNIGAGLMHLTDSSGVAVISTYNELQFKPGALGGSGTRTISVISQNASHVPFAIKAAASQTANLEEWRNSAGTALSYIRADCSFKPASLADSSAANDTFYYSTTASKLCYKDSGGVVNALY